MTTKAAFTDEEWDVLREAPPAAGMIVITASRGGALRETFEMAKVYGEAHKRPGESELLDELVAAKPERDHTKAHSLDELKQHGLARLGEAVALLEQKATPAEVEAYKGFVVTLAERVAARHEEDGADVSPEERKAIDEITAALGQPSG